MLLQKTGLFCSATFLLYNIYAAEKPVSNQNLTAENRKLWQLRTKGKNLALGKKLSFSQSPNYRLTVKGGTDAADLTDGQLSKRKNDTIWFDSKAVGWYGSNAANGINLLIDLGQQQSVGRLVIRCLGGKCQPNLVCPAAFEVFVSKNGKDFYPAASMHKLMEGEKSQSDFKKYFYLDESGMPWAYPFELQVDAEARYVGITVTGESEFIFMDELALMESSAAERKSPEFNMAYKRNPEQFFMSGIVVRPRINKLVISTNIATPNSLSVRDMRDKNSAKKKATLVIELPEGLDIELSKPARREKTEKGTKISMPLSVMPRRGQAGMFFFKAAKATPGGKEAVFYVLCDGEKTIKQKVPVELVKIPEVKPELKRLYVGLSWMSEGNALEWPDFFDAWKTLGFNVVSSFPRYWKKANTAQRIEFLKTAKAKGFAVQMNESPFHVMARGHKPGAEVFSQLAGKKSSNLCPSYRGEFYTKEMKRVEENVRKCRPDYVFWDIECWYRGSQEADRCSRCKSEQQASGKSMDEFLKDKITETFKDLKEAVRKGSEGAKMPLVASYNHQAAKPVHHDVIDFNRIYPDYIQQSQPSLYVCGRAQDVHDSIRKNYQLLKRKNTIPWLSAGTYGEFEPYKLEQMILEALLNGAGGITYYCYTNFDTPLDFYYHAKALAEIAPYEDLIVDGEVLEPKGSNSQLTYSGVKKGDEMLLLVGNYANASTATEYKTPFNKVFEIKDLRSGKQLTPSANIKLDVPREGIRLLYIKGK